MGEQKEKYMQTGSADYYAPKRREQEAEGWGLGRGWQKVYWSAREFNLPGLKFLGSDVLCCPIS